MTFPAGSAGAESDELELVRQAAVVCELAPALATGFKAILWGRRTGDDKHVDRHAKSLQQEMILKIGAVIAITALAYAGAGAALLGNASAVYFPRQLAVLLLTAAASSVAAAGLSRSGRLILVALAAASAAGLVSHPSLEELRLQAFAKAIPVSSAGTTPDGAARCFCATRASLLEFFGTPDFVGDGNRGTARIYAYAPDRSSGRLVLYELSGRSGAEDRVIGIREDSAAPGSLGLAPW